MWNMCSKAVPLYNANLVGIEPCGNGILRFGMAVHKGQGVFFPLKTAPSGLLAPTRVDHGPIHLKCQKNAGFF